MYLLFREIEVLKKILLLLQVPNFLTDVEF